MDKEAVDRWRRGQAAASKKIEEERTSRIFSLTPENSLRIFLSLRSVSRRNPASRAPSPVLIAMRETLDRRADRVYSHR